MIQNSSTKNDFLEFSFTGTGIEYLAQKDPNYEKAAVYLDGKLAETVDLQILNFPRISKIRVFTTTGLYPGKHTIKIVNTGDELITFDGFNVFE